MSRTTETREAARARWEKSHDKYNEARRRVVALRAEKKRRNRALAVLDRCPETWALEDYKDAQVVRNTLFAQIEITMLLAEGYIEPHPQMQGYFRQKRTEGSKT